MAIRQNTDLDISNRHINKQYNVVLCYPDCMHGNADPIINFSSYITPDVYYNDLTLSNVKSLSANHYTQHNTLTCNSIYTTYVTINSGICKTTNEYSSSKKISTKQFVDHALYSRITNLINIMESSVDVYSSYNDNCIAISSKSITPEGSLSVPLKMLSSSSTTSRFIKNNSDSYSIFINKTFANLHNG